MLGAFASPIVLEEVLLLPACLRAVVSPHLAHGLLREHRREQLARPLVELEALAVEHGLVMVDHLGDVHFKILVI